MKPIRILPAQINMKTNMPSRISVVINTLNEENNIRDCIQSIKSIADEIIVCDMYSQDKTVEIAKELGAIIVYHEKTGYVEPARYYAISKASYEWVLIMDADEVMTEKLAEKLADIVNEDKVDVVFIGVLYNYFGKLIKHGGFFNNNWPKLFRKKIYLQTYDKQDEFIHHGFINLKKKVSNRIKLPLTFFIEHSSYPSVESYIHKTIGKYALIEAEGMFRRGDKFKLSKLIFQPLRVFITAYMFKKGFLDGLAGFILAVLYMVFRFVVWANLWFLVNQHEQAGLAEKR